ncbi:EpsG family protein [Streptococcus sp. 20-1249]|uniref:EpsG family protein n=1 Tax=Streptococcus hepaticus TaxID=3349163 RepID=UPI003749D480
MIPYIIIITLPLLGFALGSRIKDNWYYIDFLTITITSYFLSIRENIGVDLLTYRGNFYRFANHLSKQVDFPDKGYNILESIFVNLNLSFNNLLFFIAFFNLSVVFFYLRTSLIRSKTLALFFYLIIFDLYVYSLAAIRQSIALSLIVLAIYFLKNEKLWMCVIFSLIAYLFHWSALGVLPILLFLRYKNNFNVITLFLIPPIILLSYFILIKSPVVSLIAQFNYNTKYYLEILRLSTGSGMSLVALIEIFIAELLLFIYIFVRKFNNDGKLYLQFRHKATISVEIALVVLFLILHSCNDLYYISAIPRFEMYFYQFIPFVVVNQIESKLSGKYRFIFFVLIIALFSIQFYFKVKANELYYGNPKFNF